jgi:hypothetical protein
MCGKCFTMLHSALGTSFMFHAGVRCHGVSITQCFLNCLVNTQIQARHVSLCAPIVNHGLFRQCIVGKHWDIGNIEKRYTGFLCERGSKPRVYCHRSPLYIVHCVDGVIMLTRYMNSSFVLFSTRSLSHVSWGKSVVLRSDAIPQVGLDGPTCPAG